MVQTAAQLNINNLVSLLEFALEEPYQEKSMVGGELSYAGLRDAVNNSKALLAEIKAALPAVIESDAEKITCPHCFHTETVSISEPMFALTGEHAAESLGSCCQCKKDFVVQYHQGASILVEDSSRFGDGGCIPRD